MAAHRPHSFTLVELLVAIAIVLILVGITVAGVGYARRRAAEAKTVAILEQFAHGLEAFRAEKGFYPVCPSTATNKNVQFRLNNNSKLLIIINDNTYTFFSGGQGLLPKKTTDPGYLTQSQIDDLDGGKACAFMDVDRDAAAIVFDGARPVLVQGYFDFGAVAVGGFVDAVIDDFPNQMVKATTVCGADIHARAFADALHFRQQLNVVGSIRRGVQKFVIRHIGDTV